MSEVLVLPRLSWTRFIASAAVALVAVTIARLHRVPVHVAAPPAMFRGGLATHLVREFSRDTGVPVIVDSVPVGLLPRRIENGDDDIVFAHDSESVAALQQVALRTLPALQTTFVLFGPRNDPADVHSTASATEAFWQISAAQVPFQPSTPHGGGD